MTFGQKCLRVDRKKEVSSIFIANADLLSRGNFVYSLDQSVANISDANTSFALSGR
jgi:hypothetical protein